MAIVAKNLSFVCTFVCVPIVSFARDGRTVCVLLRVPRALWALLLYLRKTHTAHPSLEEVRLNGCAQTPRGSSGLGALFREVKEEAEGRRDTYEKEYPARWIPKQRLPAKDKTRAKKLGNR